MPDYLRYDTPGLTYDSGLHWDAVQNNQQSLTKMNIKAITNFSHYAEAALSPVARTIHTDMTTNAATFGTLPVSLANLLAHIDDYDAKLAAKADRSKNATVLFNAARALLEDDLSKLGNHVNNVANGDPVIVAESGFPSYDTDRPANEDPPPAPENLVLKHGKVSGSIIGRYKPGRARSMNEVQINLTDPPSAEGWLDYKTISGGRVEITGLPPGSVVWVRVRTLGLKGVVGDWSDPAMIRVL